MECFSQEQNNILNESINRYVDNYISGNRLPSSLKDKIVTDKFDDIHFNLHNNNILLENIRNNIIKIDELPWLEPHQLDITHWKSHIDKINKNRETKEKMATVNIFKCNKCGENKCTTYQLQTASIDEPMTTYVSCKVCGNSWKFH